MNAPVLTSPVADTALSGTDTTLLWEPVDGAVGYRVQVAADPDFDTLVVDQRLGAVTSLHVRHLVPGNDGKLYWRVAAKGGAFATASFVPASAPERIQTPFAGDRTSLYLLLASIVLSLVTAIAAFVVRPTDVEASTVPTPADSTVATPTNDVPASAAAAPTAADTSAAPAGAAPAGTDTSSAAAGN